MSLEANIKQLAETMERNNALLEKLIEGGVIASPSGAEAKVEKAESKTKPKAEKAESKTKPKAEPKTTKKPVDDFNEQDAEVEGLDYDADVKPYILSNAKEHREEIVGILSRYGAKKATELKPEQYQEFLDRLKNAIENGLETDSDFMEQYDA